MCLNCKKWKGKIHVNYVYNKKWFSNTSFLQCKICNKIYKDETPSAGTQYLFKSPTKKEITNILISELGRN